jgi:hypothetical protein
MLKTFAAKKLDSFNTIERVLGVSSSNLKLKKGWIL